MVYAPVTKATLQELYIGFVDDTEFFTMGDNFQEKMQSILD